MGISGLLPVLKSVTNSKHVKDYRGERVCIDGFSWVHKGAYSCSRELCEGVFTDKFVRYCMSRIEMLIHHRVTPIVVFDGGRLPMKAEEEDSRRSSRNENREKALAHLAAGNTAAAEECFQRAVNISSGMIKQFVEALKERGVEFLVAPYEADAQMAYLALSGNVHAVITEDSDLLVYGCPKILYKLDKHGQGEEIRLEDLPMNTGISFTGFSHEMFSQTCIMAGCGFLPSLPNIGIKKAHALIKKHRGFVKACKNLRFSGVAVPRDYEERLQRTLWVFRHQRVFCPRSGKVVHLRPLPPGGLGARDVDVMSAVPSPDDPLDFLGPVLEDNIARGIATGDIDPNTKQPHDLVRIFHGCSYLPKGVAAALGVPPGHQRGHRQYPQKGASEGVTSGRSSGGIQRSSGVHSVPSSQGSQQQGRSSLGSGVATLHDLATKAKAFSQPSQHHPGPFATAPSSSQRQNAGGAAGGTASIRSFFPAIGAEARAPFVPPRRASDPGTLVNPLAVSNNGEAKSPFDRSKRKRLGMSLFVPIKRGGTRGGGVPTLTQDAAAPPLEVSSSWIVKGKGTANGTVNPFVRLAAAGQASMLMSAPPPPTRGIHRPLQPSEGAEASGRFGVVGSTVVGSAVGHVNRKHRTILDDIEGDQESIGCMDAGDQRRHSVGDLGEPCEKDRWHGEEGGGDHDDSQSDPMCLSASPAKPVNDACVPPGLIGLLEETDQPQLPFNRIDIQQRPRERRATATFADNAVGGKRSAFFDRRATPLLDSLREDEAGCLDPIERIELVGVERSGRQDDGRRNPRASVTPQPELQQTLSRLSSGLAPLLSIVRPPSLSDLGSSGGRRGRGHPEATRENLGKDALASVPTFGMRRAERMGTTRGFFDAFAVKGHSMPDSSHPVSTAHQASVFADGKEPAALTVFELLGRRRDSASTRAAAEEGGGEVQHAGGFICLVSEDDDDGGIGAGRGQKQRKGHLGVGDPEEVKLLPGGPAQGQCVNGSLPPVGQGEQDADDGHGMHSIAHIGRFRKLATVSLNKVDQHQQDSSQLQTFAFGGSGRTGRQSRVSQQEDVVEIARSAPGPAPAMERKKGFKNFAMISGKCRK